MCVVVVVEVEVVEVVMVVEVVEVVMVVEVVAGVCSRSCRKMAALGSSTSVFVFRGSIQLRGIERGGSAPDLGVSK